MYIIGGYKLKICLIKVIAQSNGPSYRGILPSSILAVASATPPGIEIELVDETIEKINYATDADLIGLSVATPSAPKAYEIADNFKRLGKTVVFGGLHPSFLTEEALVHGDAVVLGEAEGLWENLIADFQQGKMRRTYENEQVPDLSKLRPFRKELVDWKKYGNMWSVNVSRGCRHRCEFCCLSPFFKKQRYRPIACILEEIQASGAKVIDLYSENIVSDPFYAKSLFTALKPLGIKWFSQATMGLAENPELLKLAAESGLESVITGIETPSPCALKGADKNFHKPDRIKENVRRYHHYGIVVDSVMIFGFDQHDKDIFGRTLDFVEDIELDICTPAFLTPLPGTRLFEKLDSEGRIFCKDWSKYDFGHIVFQPKLMSIEELYSGMDWFCTNYYSPWRQIKRVLHQCHRTGPIKALTSLSVNRGVLK
jgi:radical SAM superfamily enzyme YgiQ (UPF0313 family)